MKKCVILCILLFILIAWWAREQESTGSTATVRQELITSTRVATIGLEQEEMKEEQLSFLTKNPTIRVCIKTSDYASHYHKQVEITCTDTYLIQEEGKVMTKEAGECFIPDETESLQYLIMPIDQGRILLLNHQRNTGFGGFRGTIELDYTEKGWQVINVLPLEEYLYGVVPSEMPSGYPMEALKAQAVCARSYAYDKLLHPGLENADLDDSTSFQVYGSIPEQQSTKLAVDDTQGMVLVNNQGTLQSTMYFSTSMGENHCSNEEELREQLLSVKDEDWESGEAFYRWTYCSTDAMTTDLWEQLSAHSNNILFQGEERPFQCVKRIEITKRGPQMEAVECEIETDTGLYTIQTEYTIRKTLCSLNGMILNNRAETVHGMDLLPSPFFVLDCIVAENRVVEYNIRGGGFGHGKGMSQNGAKAMAQRGHSFQEILAFYYR